MREYWNNCNIDKSNNREYYAISIEIHYYDKDETLQSRCCYSSINELEKEVKRYWSFSYRANIAYDMWIVKPESHFAWKTNAFRKWLRELNEFITNRGLDVNYLRRAEDMMAKEVMERVHIHL